VKDFVPAAYMVYTDIQSLDGLWEPTDYGSGVEYADGVIDLFDYDTPRKPGDAASHQKQPLARTGLQIGLWLNGTAGCFDIASGNLDGRVRDLVTYLEQSRARRIFIRIGYEFDNPMFGYDDPKMYVVAFRKLVTAIRSSVSKETRNRVIFVWHSWAAPMASDDLSLESYYPGDSYVDWIGISIFQQVLPWSPDWGGKRKDVERVLRFAQERHKPTMIAESTPFGGIELKQVSNEAREYISSKPFEEDNWKRWYGSVIDLINDFDIQFFSYINCDWESQPMWKDVGFGESRVSSNPDVMRLWRDLVVNNGVEDRTFLFSGSLDNCGIEAVSVETPGFHFGIQHVYTFILIPILVASGAFFIPYVILGGQRSKRGSSSERVPILSAESVNTDSCR